MEFQLDLCTFDQPVEKDQAMNHNYGILEQKHKAFVKNEAFDSVKANY